MGEVPTLRMLCRPLADIAAQAERIAAAIGHGGQPAATVMVLEGVSQTGGGSLPGRDLPTRLVAVSSPLGPEKLAARLRVGNPPVFARISTTKYC